MTNEFVFLVLHGDISGMSVECVCSTEEWADAVADELGKRYEGERVVILQAPVDGPIRPLNDDGGGWRRWEVQP